MKLTQVENQRTQLLQFVLLLIMLLLSLITYLSVTRHQGVLIPALTTVSLLGCLYVIGRERRLRALQGQLLAELLDEQKKSSGLELRLKELTALYRAISRVSAVEDPTQICDAVLHSALELVEGDLGSIMMPDDDGQTLVIVSARGLDSEVVMATRQHIASGVAGWVASNREPALVTGKASEDGRFEDVGAHEEKLDFSASVPLVLRDELLGVLNLGVTPGEPREPFSEYDLRLVTVFAQHAVVAIQNARLRTPGG